MTAVLIGQIACAILGYFFVAGLWFSFLSPLKHTMRVRRWSSLLWPLGLALLVVGMPIAIVIRGVRNAALVVRR